MITCLLFSNVLTTSLYAYSFYKFFSSDIDCISGIPIYEYSNGTGLYVESKNYIPDSDTPKNSATSW